MEFVRLELKEFDLISAGVVKLNYLYNDITDWRQTTQFLLKRDLDIEAEYLELKQFTLLLPNKKYRYTSSGTMITYI